MHRKPISQQVVVIVGSASGIGRETALQFARAGASLVTFSHSLSTWLDLHPAVKVAGLLGAAAGIGVALSRASGGHRTRASNAALGGRH